MNAFPVILLYGTPYFGRLCLIHGKLNDMVTTKTLRTLWKDIAHSPVPVAVLVFEHGLEHFSVRTDTPEQEAQLQKLLRDYEPHLMGVYDRAVSFAEMYDDFLLMTESLLDPHQKTD